MSAVNLYIKGAFFARGFEVWFVDLFCFTIRLIFTE